MAEQLINSVETTVNLAAGLDHAATTLTVTDGSVFPSSGNFRVWIDKEIMLCTARSGNDLTVTRGQEGTTATAHAQGATVIGGPTAGGITQYVSENAVGVSFPLEYQGAFMGPLVASAGTLLTGWLDSAGGGSYYRHTDTAQNNAFGFTFYVGEASTWELAMRVSQDVDKGIMHVKVDGTEIDTIDNYHATFQTAAVGLTGITLGAGAHRVEIVASTKNAAATAYDMIIFALALRRTA